MFQPQSIVQSHNETMAWCENLHQSIGAVYYVYRPNNELVASRNVFLSKCMNYRSHQSEY